MPVTPSNFDWIRRLAESRTGNLLDATKTYLVESRLSSVAESAGFASIDPLVDSLRSTTNVELERTVVEALLTHETSFFRDPHYFDELAATILPELVKRRQTQRRLNIWCAACSSGPTVPALPWPRWWARRCSTSIRDTRGSSGRTSTTSPPKGWSSTRDRAAC